MTVRVVVADDHPIYRDGVRTALAADDRVVVVGEALDGAEALDLVLDLRPDVVLMDLSMPRLDGVEATRRLTDQCPATAVLVLTMAQDDDSLFAAIKAGARGYLLKGADSEELVRAVLAVADGDAVFGPGVAGRVLRYFTTGQRPSTSVEGLTQREREILDLLATGLGNQVIARRTGIAPQDGTQPRRQRHREAASRGSGRGDRTRTRPRPRPNPHAQGRSTGTEPPRREHLQNPSGVNSDHHPSDE